MTAGDATSPATLLASLQKLVAATLQTHLPRVDSLRRQVHESAWRSDDCGLAAALRRLEDAVEALDFNLLHPRREGATAPDRAPFATQCAALAGSADHLAAQGADFAACNAAEDERIRRDVLELLLEGGAIEKRVDHGRHWIETLERELHARHAAAGNAVSEQAIRTLAQRGRQHASQLQALYALAHFCAESHELARAVIAARAGLATLLDDELQPRCKRLGALLGPLAQAARAGESAPTQAAREVQHDLQMWLAQANAAFIRIEHQEHGLGSALAALAQHVSQLDS